VINIAELRNPEYFLPYQKWIHANPELDSREHHIRVSDIDTFIQNYQTGNYLMAEWKCKFGRVGYPQNEIITLIHNKFKHSNSDGRYKGYPTLRLTDESPDDSAAILVSGELFIDGKWRLYNDKPFTPEQLTKMLQLTWD